MKKAFYCRSDYYEESAIIFAETAGKAKWYFVDQHCDGWFEDVSCRRAKHLDQYVESSNIPFSVLVADGWWTECFHCGMHIDEDTLIDEGKTVDGVIGAYTGRVYCSAECKRSALEEKEKLDKFEDEIVRAMIWKLEDRFKGAHIEFVSKHIHAKPDTRTILNASVSVKIDGRIVTYGGAVVDKKTRTFDELVKDRLTATIMPSDLPYFFEKYGVEPLPKKEFIG